MSEEHDDLMHDDDAYNSESQSLMPFVPHFTLNSEKDFNMGERSS
jgi:hypothetical protein